MQKVPYEGTKPYLFISYCHEDERLLEETVSLFEREGIRCWYDSGMYSGAFWRRLITDHLKNASACLFLCTSASCQSENVLDELEFAKSYRIPLLMVIEGSFEINDEIRLMTGRTHRTLKQQGYEKELLRGIPAEVYEFEEKTTIHEEHPLYAVERELRREKGTVFSLGVHRTLGYPTCVQKDLLKPEDKEEAWETLQQASRLHQPQFPVIYDAVMADNSLTVYEEYRDGCHLRNYVKKYQPTQNQILDIVRSFVKALKYLSDRSSAIRFLSSDNILICPDDTVYFERIHNLYYGLCRMSVETKAYYLEKMVEETGVLLSWLTSRQMPRMPLRLVENPAYSETFLNRVNMVIQRCQTGPQGKRYTSPDEVLRDLVDERITVFDAMDLNRRKKALAQYDHDLRNRLLNTNDVSSAPMISLERAYGFKTTVALNEDLTPDILENQKATVCIEIVATGQKSFFIKDSVLIGRDPKCDMIIRQMYIAREDARISRKDEAWLLEDLRSTNGTYLNAMRVNEVTELQSGDTIRLGDMDLRVYTGKDAEKQQTNDKA